MSSSMAKVVHDGLAAGENGQIFEHRLATVAVARGLDGTDLEHAAKLVDYEHRKRFAGDIFGNDEQRLLRLHDLLKEGHKLVNAIDLAFVDEYEWLFEDNLHVVRIGDEVRAEVAAIELHAFDDFNAQFRGPCLLRR